jgi:hypothetical protein
MGRHPDNTHRQRLRDLASLAYERELSSALSVLEGEFGRWRGGEINAFDVSEAVHHFHQGPARELFSRYGPSDLELVVAGAIRRGIISRDEAGRDIVERLASYLAVGDYQ